MLGIPRAVLLLRVLLTACWPIGIRGLLVGNPFSNGPLLSFRGNGLALGYIMVAATLETHNTLPLLVGFHLASILLIPTLTICIFSATFIYHPRRHGCFSCSQSGVLGGSCLSSTTPN